MQPPMTFATGLTQLGLLTSQTANFTFTSDELTQALTFAWQDSFVVNPVWDSSLTYSLDTFQYAIPTTIDNVRDIYIKKQSDLFPERLDSSLYEIVAGNIQFTRRAQYFLGDTFTLYLKGNYKLTTSDSLQTINQINYVLSHAAYLLLRQLLLKKSFVFLRNDTSMADIVNARRDMQSDMIRYKQLLQREYESA